MSRSAIQVRTIAVADTDAMRSWYAVMTAAESLRPLFLWPSFESAMRTWSLPNEFYQDVFYVAERDGAAVGAGRVTFPLHDNPHLAMLKLFVDPAARRAGVGGELLAVMEGEITDRGRDTILTGLDHPPGQPSTDLAFAEAHGYVVASREVLKAADLASTADRWPALAARAAERLGGYELVWWTDEAPEEHLDSLAHLFTRFLAEIPLEDVAIEPQVWDAARLRTNEERRRLAGTRALLVAAVAPDGSLAGYTNLAIHAGDTHASIDSTLVLPEHRGHALGLAMKTRLHQLLHEQLPEITSIVTGNAGVNRWMNDVNTALGYAEVEDSLDVQKKLPTPLPEEEA